MFNLPGKWDDFCKRYGEVYKNLSGNDRHPDDFLFTSLSEWIQGMLNKAKFKIGDKVIVTGTIDYKKSPGWAGSEITFTQAATVKDVDFYHGEFKYDVVFDKEFWKDHRGGIHQTEDKHYYGMWESRLSACPEGFVAPDPIGFNSAGENI